MPILDRPAGVVLKVVLRFANEPSMGMTYHSSRPGGKS